MSGQRLADAKHAVQGRLEVSINVGQRSTGDQNREINRRIPWNSNDFPVIPWFSAESLRISEKPILENHSEVRI